jgi:hypothetical protein
MPLRHLLSPLALHKPLHYVIPNLGVVPNEGGTRANLYCVDTTHITVPTFNPLVVLENAPEDDIVTLDDATSDHIDRESSPCFAAAVYV